MAITGTHTYQGDTADYGVTIVKVTGPTCKVQIVQHDSEHCSIPIGATVTVATDRIV